MGGGSDGQAGTSGVAWLSGAVIVTASIELAGCGSEAGTSAPERESSVSCRCSSTLLSGGGRGALK